MRRIGNKKWKLGEVICAFFFAVVAAFFLSFGAWMILHPAPGIKESGWANPSTPGAIIMFFGAVWGILFLTFILIRKAKR